PASPSALAAVPQLQWTPCSSGQAGCLELAKSWSASTTAQTYGWSVGRSPTGATRAALLRTYLVASNVYQEEYLIWDSDQGVVAAWRHQGDGSCLGLGVGDVTAGN